MFLDGPCYTVVEAGDVLVFVLEGFRAPECDSDVPRVSSMMLSMLMDRVGTAVRRKAGRLLTMGFASVLSVVCPACLSVSCLSVGVLFVLLSVYLS